MNTWFMSPDVFGFVLTCKLVFPDRLVPFIWGLPRGFEGGHDHLLLKKTTLG